jgi:AAA domain
VTAHTEGLEYVLGIGCLAWKPAEHDPVRRHLLTSRVEITLDDDTGTLMVTPQPGLETLNVELDMLDPARVQNPTHINEIQDRAREFDRHPLDRDQIGVLLRRLVNSLDASGEYRDEDDPPDYSPIPLAAFAPALIVRKRSQQGLVDIFNSIAAEISETEDIPSGLLPLLDPDHQPAGHPDPSAGAMVAVDDEILLPLPLNAVQLNIIRRVDRHVQTPVQGPPGTGKTHTAAALLSHLLAQGKRVLVTAHTDRALKEVRAKLPESIRPLAVSVVGTDRSDMADLKVAVEHLSARSGEHDSKQARHQIGAHLTEIDRLCRQRAEIRTRLIEARSTEVDTHEFAGNEGTLAQIAQTYQAETEIHGWLADLARATTDSACPLDDGSATRWLSLLRDADLLADEPEARQRLINSAEIPGPDDFARYVDGETAGKQGLAAHTADNSHAAFTTIADLSPEVRGTLQRRMRDLARRATELERRHESWMNGALRDIRGGRGGTWEARA